jgi:hypothetical protein
MGMSERDLIRQKAVHEACESGCARLAFDIGDVVGVGPRLAMAGRMLAGLTVEAVADLAGLWPSTIAAIEQWHNGPVFGLNRQRAIVQRALEQAGVRFYEPDFHDGVFGVALVDQTADARRVILAGAALLGWNVAQLAKEADLLLSPAGRDPFARSPLPDAVRLSCLAALRRAGCHFSPPAGPDWSGVHIYKGGR